MGVSSEGRGLGSNFYFELPLYSAASAGVEIAEQPARKLVYATPARQKRPNATGLLTGSTMVSEESPAIEQDCVLSNCVSEREDDGSNGDFCKEMNIFHLNSSTSTASGRKVAVGPRELKYQRVLSPRDESPRPSSYSIAMNSLQHALSSSGMLTSI